MIRFTQPGPLGDFERQIMPHLDPAFSLARFLMRNEDDARDVVQEAALRAFRFYESFRGENSRAWFLSIVRNACFTALKRQRAAETYVEFDEELHSAGGQPVDPGKEIDRELDRQAVRAAIERLAPEFREVIVLRELEECSYKEIADIAGVPIGTVMSRLARARQQLHQILCESYEREK